MQNVGSSLYTFGDIRRKLLCTGLYQDVRITLEQDHDAKSSEFANKDSPKEYGIESPLATHARIILKPSGVYNSTAGTTSLVDDSASVAISRSYMNLLGRADSESFHLGLKYNPQTSKWEGKSLKGSFSLPLAKNPSVRASLNFDGVKVNQRSKSYMPRPTITMKCNTLSVQVYKNAGFWNKQIPCQIFTRGSPLLIGTSVV